MSTPSFSTRLLSMPEKVSAAGFGSRDATVVALFPARAREHPDAPAIVVDGIALSYAELDRQAGILATQLRDAGVGPNSIVGLCTGRSAALAVGALGIMKAGAAYLPLDLGHPADRLAYMLEDAGAPVLVTAAGAGRRLPQGPWRVLEMASALYCPTPELVSFPSPRDLAYAIYTSGSTGRPKGVPITHAALSNLVNWHLSAFAVTARDRASHIASPGFDAAVWELWPYLAAGASVHMIPDDARLHPEHLRDWLVAQRITIAFAPTPVAEQLIALAWPPETALRILLTGADTLHRTPPQGLPFTLVNNYGPTECTVVATSGVVAPGLDRPGLPPIGRPIANTRVYILDENLRSVPEGETGEICIAGAGVAHGYINNPGLTAASFAVDPFDSAVVPMYRTGDLGRCLPDGQIAFHGRRDDQIKIRGFRIEPAEITAALNLHPAVKESAVVARGDADSRELAAYVVFEAGQNTGAEELQKWLGSRLPDYMVPRVFMRLDALPLAHSGKLDRTALPEPGPANLLRGEAAGATNPLERKVADVVAGLLKVEAVGVEENFFMLGGNSLLGAQLIAALRQTFDVQIGLRALFGAPTVAALAREVERLSASGEARK